MEAWRLEKVRRRPYRDCVRNRKWGCPSDAFAYELCKEVSPGLAHLRLLILYRLSRGKSVERTCFRRQTGLWTSWRSPKVDLLHQEASEELYTTREHIVEYRKEVATQ
jgi:hypothetical protein